MLPPWANPARRGSSAVVSYQLLRTLLLHPPAPIVRSPLSRRDRSALLYSVLWSDVGSQMEVPEEPLVEPASTRTLASILRIGQCLDATLSNLVSGVKVLKTEFWVRILVRSLGSVEREVAEANSYCRVLEESLNTRVVIQEIVED